MKIIFVSTTKIGENKTNIFKIAVFHNKFKLCHIKPNTSIYETKFASNKHYLSRLVTSRNA